MFSDNKLPYALVGKFLIATPSMPDERFHQSVILICANGDKGSMGLIINKLSIGIHLKDLAKQLNIESALENNPVLLNGGPLEVGRGFVVHSPEYNEESTITINGEVSLTATIDVIKGIAMHTGPNKSLVILGYTGWACGQLEDEIEKNDWLCVKGSTKVLFNTPIEQRWYQALKQAGLDPAMMTRDIGHS